MRNKHPDSCSDLSIQTGCCESFLTKLCKAQTSSSLTLHLVPHAITADVALYKKRAMKTTTNASLFMETGLLKFLHACSTYMRWGDLCTVKGCLPSTKVLWRSLATTVKLKHVDGRVKEERVRRLIHFISSFPLLSLFCTYTCACHAPTPASLPPQAAGF